jgi:hypothetical protein
MNNATQLDPGSKAVVIVAVDMTDVSEHLLVTAKNLLRHAADASLHLVHVLPMHAVVPLFEYAAPLAGAQDDPRVARARFELGRLCEDLADRPTMRPKRSSGSPTCSAPTRSSSKHTIGAASRGCSIDRSSRA